MKMEKRKFRIGELAQNLAIKQFVIRFWEKEFDITPDRSQGGQRFYSEEDFEKFKLIKELLYEKRFTLEGAKTELSQKNKQIIPSKKTVIYQEDEITHNINLELQQKLMDLRRQLIKLKEAL